MGHPVSVGDNQRVEKKKACRVYQVKCMVVITERIQGKMRGTTGSTGFRKGRGCVDQLLVLNNT